VRIDDSSLGEEDEESKQTGKTDTSPAATTTEDKEGEEAT